MTLALQLFGAASVHDGATSSPLLFERRGQLVAYLALKRTWVPRSEAAVLLWPEQESRLALTNLRKALFRLQRLRWAARVEANADALRFDVATDVAGFERALADGRFADAVTLRRGELLQGFDDGGNDAWTRWLGFERDRLRVAWRGAAQAMLAGDIEPAAGADLAARLLDEDPFDEAALRALMSCLARAGQLPRARQAYRDFVGRLERELGLAPGTELQALHEALLAPRAGGAAPAAPAADDGFIGRSVELRRLAALLAQDDCRLLCLTGPGGVGKTRLARRLIEELGPGFADGAHFIALDDLAAPGELAARLAHELGLEVKGRSEPLDRLVSTLQARHSLLVLDNFEQLVDAAPLLERLLAGCPRLKIVVTSRLRLALGAEWLLPLEGLPGPDDEDLDRIEAFDAARLFVRAARRLQPDFSPVAEAAAIVDICRRTAGLPLALELVASWTRVLSCAAIVDELRRGTELLHAADPAQPPRHASMDDVFEQSWRLLTEGERQVLARLSVFHGSFTSEAARAVAGARLPLLAALSDKSLLHRDQARMRLHPLVQQLAAERLDDADRTATQQAHARLYHDLLHQLRRQIENADREAMLRVDDEFENCRAAWRWAAAQGQGADLRRSVPALTQYCDHRSRSREGLELLREAIAPPGAQRDNALLALLLGKAARLEYLLDCYDDAVASAAAGLALVGDGADADADARAQCLKVLGAAQLRLGRYQEARRDLEAALALAPACSDPRHRATILTTLALVHKGLGDYDATLRLTHEALAQQRLLGDVASEALSLNNLAALHIERQQYGEAVVHLRASLALCDARGLETTRGAVLANLSQAALRAGELDTARDYGRRALEHALAVGNRFLTAYLHFNAAELEVLAGNLRAARAELRTGIEQAIAVARPVLLIEALGCLARIVAADGDAAGARAIAAFAASHRLASPLDREALAAFIAALPAPPGRSDDLTLDQLAQRLVAETDVASEPLLALLGRAG